MRKRLRRLIAQCRLLAALAGPPPRVAWRDWRRRGGEGWFSRGQKGEKMRPGRLRGWHGTACGGLDIDRGIDLAHQLERRGTARPIGHRLLNVALRAVRR